MASQVALHVEYEELSRLGGYGVRRAGIDKILTDANVAAATKADDLIVNAQNVSSAVHDEYAVPESLQTIAALQRGQAIGDFSNARVVAAVNVAGLAASTAVADEVDQGHLGPRIIG